MKPGSVVLKELVPLRNGEYLKYLKALRQDALERCAKAPRDAVEKIQGEAEVLERMISLVENSRKELDEMSSSKPQMSNAF